MSDSSNDSGTDLQLDSSSEETTEVISEESGDLATVAGSVVPAVTNGAAPALPDAAEQNEVDRAEQASWVPLAVGVFLVVLIASVAIFLLLQPRGGNPDPSQQGRGVAEQADWKVTTFSIGGNNPGGKQPAPPKEQARAVENLVRDFHDALFLFPTQLQKTTKKYFTAPAADALAKSDIGLPASVEKIQTTRRFARIGIEGDGAHRAAAVVGIVAKGQSKGGPFRVVATSRLWLERAGSEWDVVAFDLDQGPLNVEPKAGGDPKPKPHDKKPPKDADPKKKPKGSKKESKQ